MSTGIVSLIVRLNIFYFNIINARSYKPRFYGSHDISLGNVMFL